MRKTLAVIAAILAVLGVGGYAAGLFTTDEVKRESCSVCRASRFVGTRYGFRYAKVEESALSSWYRKAMDPEHGKTESRAHDWRPSGCPVYASPGAGGLEAACPSISPIFYLKPETQLAALTAAPDNRTRQAIIDALNVSDRQIALDRVKRIVEFVYVYQPRVTWASWWRKNGSAFGLSASARPLARR